MHLFPIAVWGALQKLIRELDKQNLRRLLPLVAPVLENLSCVQGCIYDAQSRETHHKFQIAKSWYSSRTRQVSWVSNSWVTGETRKRHINVNN
jgi:hypothetical protein